MDSVSPKTRTTSQNPSQMQKTSTTTKKVAAAAVGIGSKRESRKNHREHTKKASPNPKVEGVTKKMF